MSAAKHTPGPWSFPPVPTDEFGVWQITAADGRSLMGNEQYYPWVPVKKADWQLIAAAPEMLEALQHIVSGFVEVYGEKRSSGAMKHARAAIAKATGEQA